ncbi:hypothetical protein LZ30DRAFT_771455 [Colletotrichum cereale]|nr:hypothetical protein LZ30DRAFT_771455 [Colletotrichum cereale]
MITSPSCSQVVVRLVCSILTLAAFGADIKVFETSRVWASGDRRLVLNPHNAGAISLPFRAYSPWGASGSLRAPQGAIQSMPLVTRGHPRQRQQFLEVAIEQKPDSPQMQSDALKLQLIDICGSLAWFSHLTHDPRPTCDSCDNWALAGVEPEDEHAALLSLSRTTSRTS